MVDLRKVRNDLVEARQRIDIEVANAVRVAYIKARDRVEEPDILLADEPTGALDAETGREIMRLFIELNATERLTAVIITHDREVARQCARRLRVLDGVLSETAKGAGTAAPAPS